MTLTQFGLIRQKQKLSKPQVNTVRSESRCALIQGVESLEVMSTSVYVGLNPFNFIRKQYMQICL